MNTLMWKRRLSALYPISSYKPRKIILLYHSVGNTPWAMPGHQFSEQMQWLVDTCEVLSLNELIHSKAGEKIQVAITFDDGYACLHDFAASILESKKIPAFIYLNTGWISETSFNRYPSDAGLGHYSGEHFLTWEEVSILHKQGWEFGSHGVNHLDLTCCSTDHAYKELLFSKKDLEARLKKNVGHFAYTWGRHNANLRKTVQSVGYSHAVAAHHEPLSHKMNAFAIPRMNIANEYSFHDFKAIVSGKWDFLGLIHKFKRLSKNN